jgi:hypothetical protein
LCYTGGWKKFEPLWNFIIKTKHLNSMLPLLEALLSEVRNQEKTVEEIPAEELAVVGC